jgi:beta-ureidopropionase / N-carbamoyl-L-amino-acid hydrolase
LRPQVDRARLRADLEELAQIGRTPAGGISRTAYSAADAAARGWYAARCRDAGLELSLDGLGNMFAGSPRTAPQWAEVWTGSHLDTVPEGGAFDGAVGAVAALECVRAIAEAGAEVPRPVRAVVFADEEGYFGGRLLGSFGLAHGYSRAELDSITGVHRERLAEVLSSWPWADGDPTDTAMAPGRIHAFVELHIEQGPRLEQERTDIGVVTAITGLCGARVEFAGQPGHAGTTPMTGRRDALVGAAAFVSALPDLAAAVSVDAVVTCGTLRVWPGAANVIPGLVSLTLDFRDPDRERLATLRDRLAAAAMATAAAHGVTATWHQQPLIDPVPMHAGVRRAIITSADALGLSRMDLPSRAGHDAQNMAVLGPAGMIFVPSRGGRSHVADEYTSFDAIAAGADVLLAALLDLAYAEEAAREDQLRHPRPDVAGPARPGGTGAPSGDPARLGGSRR